MKLFHQCTEQQEQAAINSQRSQLEEKLELCQNLLIYFRGLDTKIKNGQPASIEYLEELAQNLTRCEQALPILQLELGKLAVREKELRERGTEWGGAMSMFPNTPTPPVTPAPATSPDVNPQNSSRISGFLRALGLRN